MHELKLKDNNTNYKVLYDDYPVFNKIPKELLDVLISELEKEINAIIEGKEKRRKYYLMQKERESLKRDLSVDN